MRASGASELRKKFNFHIFKMLFLSMFCWYKCMFVGTNDILVGSHPPTDFQMYRQNSEKALLGGNCPPPPSCYASDQRQTLEETPGPRVTSINILGVKINFASFNR